MKTKRRVFLVHGWECAPNEHWFPWISHQLADRGFAVFAPTLPNTMHPKLSEWLSELSRVIAHPDENTFLVAHSLGCITAARFLAGLSEGVKIGGAVFVGGFWGKLEHDWADEVKEFWETPFDIEAAKARCKKFISIASEDDEIVPFAMSEEFSKKLGGTFIAENGKGHFCMGDGVTQLQSAFEAVLSLES